MKKIKSYHRQKNFKWQILHVCLLMGLLLVMLSSMGDAQAYDWPIEGQDSIFANGSLLPEHYEEVENELVQVIWSYIQEHKDEFADWQ